MKVDDRSSFSVWTRNTEVHTGWWTGLDATRRADTRKVVIGVLAWNGSRQSPHREELHDGSSIRSRDYQSGPLSLYLLFTLLHICFSHSTTTAAAQSLNYDSYCPVAQLPKLLPNLSSTTK